MSFYINIYLLGLLFGAAISCLFMIAVTTDDWKFWRRPYGPYADKKDHDRP